MAPPSLDDAVETRRRGAANGAVTLAGLALCGWGAGATLGFGGQLAGDFGGVAGYAIVLAGAVLGYALARIHIEMFSGVSGTLAVVVVVCTAASRLLAGVFEGFDSATSGLLTGMGLWLMARMVRRHVERVEAGVRGRRPQWCVLAAAVALGLAASVALGEGNGNADGSLIWATVIIAVTGAGVIMVRRGVAGG